MNTSSLRDHIAIDGGIWLPMGGVADRLDMEAGYGFNLHFWKAISENTIMLGTIGNAWYRLGSAVETDSGIQDLTDYSMTTSPLLGGIGQVFPAGDLRPWAAIHAGATIIDVETGGYPVTYIEDNAYFTMAATAGVAYPVSQNVSVLFSGRYMFMFGAELSHLDILAGASFHW